MLDNFTDDSSLTFEGIPVGPFHGKAAIAAAYATQPPDDDITVLAVRENGDILTATYAWHRDPGVPAGEMVITARNGAIASLLVRYGLVSPLS
jgi:steroid delta-isomerase